MKITGLFREVSNWVRGLFIPSLEKANTATEYMQAITGCLDWQIIKGHKERTVTSIILKADDSRLLALFQMFRDIGMTQGTNNKEGISFDTVSNVSMYFKDQPGNVLSHKGGVSGDYFMFVDITTHVGHKGKICMKFETDETFNCLKEKAEQMKKLYENLKGNQLASSSERLDLTV